MPKPPSTDGSPPPDDSVSPPPRLIRVKEVCERLSVTRTTVWRWVRDGHLPPKRQIGPNVVGFLEHEIDEFIARTAAAKGSAAEQSEGPEPAPPHLSPRRSPPGARRSGKAPPAAMSHDVS